MIVVENLNKRTLCSSFVPLPLKEEQKDDRVVSHVKIWLKSQTMMLNFFKRLDRTMKNDAFHTILQLNVNHQHGKG